MVVKNKRYSEMRIKNIRYNVTTFAFASTIALHTLVKTLFPSAEESPIIQLEPIIIENIIESNFQGLEVINIELENEIINLEIKEYSGMNLSHELEDEIKRLAEIYEIPYQIVLTIGERESAGSWNNNGIISSSGDYGVFQINECNLEYIEEQLGYTKEEILYDPVKNAEACMYLLKNILTRDDVDTLEEIFGMYNGWVGWREKPLAVKYSSACCEILNEYFPDYEYTVPKKY